MTFEIERRTLLQMLGLGVVGSAALGDSLPAFAQSKDTVTIGWPSDVPSWDPNQRFAPDAQSIFKLVFDTPIDKGPDLKYIPRLATKWELAADGMSLAVDLRDDVVFHNGDKMTAEDFRYTFFERIKAGHAVDTKNSFRKVSDIEIQSPTKVVMKFSEPNATVVQWLGFMGSFVVPKKYMEANGVEKFRDKQVGTGDALFLQRAGGDQGRARPHRAQVGVEAHSLAQAKQALLGARRVGVGGVPFGAADGAEQDRVGGAAGRQHLVGEGDAVGVDRDAAEQPLVELELAQGPQQLPRGSNDFRADPVTGQDNYAGWTAHAAGL